MHSRSFSTGVRKWLHWKNFCWTWVDTKSSKLSDSSKDVCIEDCTISTGYDSIALKSGWDEYGIAFGKPTRDIQIRRVNLQSSTGAAIAFGSEMSGGISNVLVEQVHLYNSDSGVEFRTTKGRGGYIENVMISNVEMKNVHKAFGACGQCGSHPDDKYDPSALPFFDYITIEDVIGTNITVAGSFIGIKESPFTSICLFNISLSINSGSAPTWECSNVSGSSELVFPEPCPELKSSYSNSSSACYSLSTIYGKATALWYQPFLHTKQFYSKGKTKTEASTIFVFFYLFSFRILLACRSLHICTASFLHSCVRKFLVVDGKMRGLGHCYLFSIALFNLIDYFLLNKQN